MTLLSKMVGAVCQSLISILLNSFSSDVANPRSRADLVAPLYISNDHFSSTLELASKADTAIEAFVTFDSLEGEEIARRPITLSPRSSIRIDVDDVPMARHRFPALGSLSISVLGASTDKALIGRVAIVSRVGRGKVHVEEDLQSSYAYSSPLRVGFVPTSFSIPVLAIHSSSQLPQDISVVCSDGAGVNYESQFLLPAHLTLLINACVHRRTETRTYQQLLSGDTGPMRPEATIRVKTAGLQSATSVWGFAASSSGAASAPQILGIEFTELDPGGEFLQGAGPLGANSRN